MYTFKSWRFTVPLSIGSCRKNRAWQSRLFFLHLFYTCLAEILKLSLCCTAPCRELVDLWSATPARSYEYNSIFSPRLHPFGTTLPLGIVKEGAATFAGSLVPWMFFATFNSTVDLTPPCQLIYV